MKISVGKKIKKRKVIPVNKVYIYSPYKLSNEEINRLKEMFPIMRKDDISNVIEKDMLAGVIIRVGTKLIDLSLSRGLQNLQQFIYENH